MVIIQAMGLERKLKAYKVLLPKEVLVVLCRDNAFHTDFCRLYWPQYE